MTIKGQVDLDELTVDASYLAGRFGLSPAAFRRYMAQGLVRSRVEIGQEADIGKTRLTVRLGNRIWIAVLAADGSVVSEETRFAASAPPRPAT
ncbi:DUF6522 family protein [Rhizobium sp. 3T7]|jgi:hypothetical protein|uniref:DUF6522 family protein n=1 Tax=Rhizobium sp. 3T7 TaxID=2874922 RepID=UPI001CCFC152|nr:DUF6522 family protein [Rhizobium sp. 3T7]MBZ9793858.1 DUF6522 family protein [Rhizobium sp. 3T7]